MPVHPTLETMLDEYISFCGLTMLTTPLFQSLTARGGYLTDRPFAENYKEIGEPFF